MFNDKEFKNSAQRGRTMTEMLGVLLIIGVLSVLTLYGFQYALFRYRVGQTLNQISAAVAGARTIDLQGLGISMGGDENGLIRLPVHYVISGVRFTDDPLYFRTPLNADVGVYRDTNGIWRVSVKFTELMAMHDCEALLTSPVAVHGIGYNGRIYTQESLMSDSHLLEAVCRYYTQNDE